MAIGNPVTPDVTFARDDRIAELFQTHSFECIEMASTDFAIDLQVTSDSIQQVEAIAAKLHEQLAPLAMPEGVMHGAGRTLGSHIAHVLIVVHGWTPGMAFFAEGQIPAVQLEGGSMCWPWGKAHNRLVNGEEDNLWHYYLGLISEL